MGGVGAGPGPGGGAGSGTGGTGSGGIGSGGVGSGTGGVVIARRLPAAPPVIPGRCLADHAGVLGDVSWDEIRWPAPIRGRAMTRLRLHGTVRLSARSRQRSLPATRAVCL